VLNCAFSRVLRLVKLPIMQSQFLRQLVTEPTDGDVERLVTTLGAWVLVHCVAADRSWRCTVWVQADKSQSHAVLFI